MLDTTALMPLVTPLAAALGTRGLRLATAESCTGGLIAAACTALAGSSTWFERGFVSYSNAAKTELLGVPAGLIAAQGAVSEAVARAMAAGALEHSVADLALAVTGIAGPDGAAPGKPVGTVWLAWAWRGGETGARHLQLDGDRAAVRAQTVAAALQQALALALAVAATPTTTGTIDRPAQREGTAAMSDGVDYTRMVPGFDFLQNLVRGAGAAAPAVGQWVAPTLDPDEIGKRIDELRTVQFWLEQNARLLATTIQALEVQRMTLSTLKNMNVRLTDLRDALTLRVPEPPAPPPAPARATAAAPAPASPAAPAPAEASGAEPPSDAASVEPMQWWGALTRQFTEIAAHALRETSAAAAAATAATGASVEPTASNAPTAGKPARPPARKKAPARKTAAPAAAGAGKPAARRGGKPR